jgi:hypothetical protein
MTLPTVGHHARVVVLGGIAKRKGVLSRANLLIYVKCLWVTLPPLVTMRGQCPLTSFLKEKTIRIKIKGMHFPAITAPLAQTSLTTSSTHMAWICFLLETPHIQ